MASEPMSFREVATLLKNIENYGFTLSDDLLKKLLDVSVIEVELFYSNIIGALKKSVGAHVQHKPMYPNFPKQVMEASEAELYLNAILHYFGDWIGERIMPHYIKEDRPTLNGKFDLKVIGLGTEEEFKQIFTNLVASKRAVSEEDKKEIEWFVQEYKNNIENILPKDISNKENKIYLITQMNKYVDSAEEAYAKYFKTATDVLRFAVALSDGDVSLAGKPKFKNFSRKERRMLKSLANRCGSLKEDMVRYREYWKRLNEKIHIFENDQYHQLGLAMKAIAEDEKILTFNSKVERALNIKDVEAVTELLQQRPGDFARRLNYVLKLAETPFGEQPHDVVEKFAEIADSVPTPILLELMTYFKYRNEEKEIRVFFPKGNVSKLKAIENELPKLNTFTLSELVTVCKKAITKQYQELESLGKVYLSEELKNFTVPFGLRSASKALKTIGRGSRLDFDDKNILRFFLYWKDMPKERVDIDLSAVSLGENFEYINHINYWSLRNGMGVHSGDLTSAPRGASEFIDLDIGKHVSNNVRYIIMSINSYTQQSFCDIPECFAGFMTRKDLQSGEIYDPKTVQNKFDLGAKSQIAIPIIFDLVERKAIWVDLSLTQNLATNNHVAGNLSSMSVLVQAMVGLHKPSLYDLFSLHVQARGELVPEKEDADIIFSLEDGITPLNSEEILANYL